MGQAQRVTDLVLSHGEEVHPHAQLGGVGPPVLVLVEVDVAAELPELVWIVGVGQDQAGPVKRITKGGIENDDDDDDDNDVLTRRRESTVRT